MGEATGADSEQTSSRELLVDLTGVPRGRLGREIEGSLRRAIRSGRLRPGARLPSTRALAADLGVSRSVVVGAYEQLAAEGYLATRPGTAARVSDAAREIPPARPVAVPAAAPARRWAVDLRPGRPDLARLPRADWERAVRRALMTLTDAELGYGDSRGLVRLRTALADYLGRVRGAVVDPDRVVVVNGFAQGLAVVARLLHQLGTARVGVEDPGSVHVIEHLAAQGVVTVPVPVDAEGIDVAAAGDPGRTGVGGDGGPLRTVLVTPAHQYPTGAVLSPARRRALLAWAERVDGLVIEDDYDAEYRYDHHPVGALQGMAPERVMLGGSTSKTLAPGLRLGWLVVPLDLAAAAAEAKHHIDLMAPVLEQAAFAELLASGRYERHVRISRARYRRRRDVLVELLAAALPEAVVSGTSAGLHLVIETPGVTSEAAVVAEAAQRGLAVVGLGAHRHAPGPPGFVLGYGHLGPDQLRRGVQALAAAVRSPGR